jgi:transcription elongation factor GreB
LSYLDRLLVDAQIIDPAHVNCAVVSFGSHVKVRDEQGTEKVYMIVGEGESDLSEGGISWKSPVARALLGKRAGESINCEVPKGDIQLQILKIFKSS